MAKNSNKEALLKKMLRLEDELKLLQKEFQQIRRKAKDAVKTGHSKRDSNMLQKVRDRLTKIF